MSTDHVAAFERSLADLEVGVTRTNPEEFGKTLGATIEKPAVGTDLPYEAVSLGGTAVVKSPTTRELQAAATGVTPARLGVASYGSIVIDSRHAGDEPISLYPRRHVAVLRTMDVVPDMTAALDALADHIADAGSSVLATGVSATGDMGAIVEGVHGPLDVHVILLES